MNDEVGKDNKILAVPINTVLPIYKHWNHVNDIFPERLVYTKHLFQHYKNLEDGKWVKVTRWYGPDLVREEILHSLKRFKVFN
tara:strand:+ start:342 stop:590 length:249 start_codon:yes stop_codon:yes gene_type:complete